MSTHWSARILFVRSVDVARLTPEASLSARGLVVQIADRETGAVGMFIGATLGVAAGLEVELPGGYRVPLTNVASASSSWSRFETVKSLDLKDFESSIRVSNVSIGLPGIGYGSCVLHFDGIDVDHHSLLADFWHGNGIDMSGIVYGFGFDASLSLGAVKMTHKSTDRAMRDPSVFFPPMWDDAAFSHDAGDSAPHQDSAHQDPSMDGGMTVAPDPGFSFTPDPSVDPGLTFTPDPGTDPGFSFTPDLSVDPGLTHGPDLSIDPGLLHTPDLSVDPGLTHPPDMGLDQSASFMSDAAVDPGFSFAPDASTDPQLNLTPDSSMDPAVNLTPDMSLDPGLGHTSDNTGDPDVNYTPDASGDSGPNYTPDMSVDQELSYASDTSGSSDGG